MKQTFLNDNFCDFLGNLFDFNNILIMNKDEVFLHLGTIQNISEDTIRTAFLPRILIVTMVLHT